MNVRRSSWNSSAEVYQSLGSVPECPTPWSSQVETGPSIVVNAHLLDRLTLTILTRFRRLQATRLRNAQQIAE
jgi:hypothetical protein